MFIHIVVFGLGASASVLMSHSVVVSLIGISLLEAIVQNPFPKCVFAGSKLKGFFRETEIFFRTCKFTI